MIDEFNRIVEIRRRLEG